jgi:hypothetical protein
MQENKTSHSCVLRGAFMANLLQAGLQVQIIALKMQPGM